MKNILLFLILAFHSNIFAQDIVEVKSRKTDEVYQVLKENKSFKDGYYTKFYKFSKRKKKQIVGFYSRNKKDSVWRYFDWNGNLTKKGRFENGQKNGRWTIYLWNSQSPSSLGLYENGAKVGIWRYFNEHGILIHKFNHTQNELLFFTRNEDAIIQQANDLDKYRESKEMVLGGNTGFLQYIRREFHYPEEAQWNGITGKVFVNFFVDENFKKWDFIATNNPGYGLGEEAIRLIKDGPLIIPAKKDGKYVGTKLSFPIGFNIQ